MKENKIGGFTLIELLAIIIILAIIAVITVPIILNIIENSRKGAAVDSAYGYKDAIEKYYLTKLSKDTDFDLDGEYTIGTKGELVGKENEDSATPSTHSIPFSGTIPSEGSISIENNVVKSACLIVDEYKVELQDGKFTTSGKGSCGVISDNTPQKTPEDAQEKAKEYVEAAQGQCEKTTAHIKTVEDLKNSISIENGPVAGWILFDKDCNVVDFSVKLDEEYNDYVVSYDEYADNDYHSTVTEEEPKEQPTFKGTVVTGSDIPNTGHTGVKAIVYLDPTNLLTVCDEEKAVSTTGTKTGCMKFYAIEALSDSSTYTMILDHNTTAITYWNYSNGNSSTHLNGPGTKSKAELVSSGQTEATLDEVLCALMEDTKNWTVMETIGEDDDYTPSAVNGGGNPYTVQYSEKNYKARLIKAEEIAKITGADKPSANGGIGWTQASGNDFLFDNESSNGTAGSNKYAWLFDYTGNVSSCIEYGCNSGLNSDPIGYWTSSPDPSHPSKVWHVNLYGYLYNIYYVNEAYLGVRPVIKISKSKLLSS